MAVASAFSWPRYRSCEVKRAYPSHRHALLRCWWRVLRGERLHAYACPWAEPGRPHFHVGHYSARAA